MWENSLHQYDSEIKAWDKLCQEYRGPLYLAQFN